MATQGWGRCPRCKNPHRTILARGLCEACTARDRIKAEEKAQLNEVATPKKLVLHPDLAEVDRELEQWYG